MAKDEGSSSVIFSPAMALSKLTNTDPTTARILMAGLAVLAAVAVATTWHISASTSATMAAYILALGLVAVVLGNAISDPILGKVLGWFFTLVIMAVVVCFLISAIGRKSGIIKPTYCLVSFWQDCDTIEARIAAENARVTDANTHVPEVISGKPTTASTTGAPAPSVDPQKFAVFIQFAGLITRESVTALHDALQRGHWNVQGKSGERTSAAAGLNEVRYGPDSDREAAQSLADSITATKIAGSPVSVHQMAIVHPGYLEVWISN